MKLFCNPFDFWFRKLKSAHKGKKFLNPGRKSDMMNSWLDKLMSIYIFIKKQLDNYLDSHYFGYIILKQNFLYLFLLHLNGNLPCAKCTELTATRKVSY